MISTTPTINTRLADLPTTVAAYTVIDEDGEYNIVINSRLSSDRQRQAYEHELRHINNQDFEKENVAEIELEAHGIEKPVQNPRPAWVDKRLKRLRKEREKVKQELAEYEEVMEPVRILWNEKKILEYQKLGE